MIVIELYHIAVLHFLYTEKEETYTYTFAMAFSH